MGRFTLEIPMYSAKLERFIELNKSMTVVLYGSLPDSPFNGGRPNFLLDGVTQEGLVPMPQRKASTMESVLKTALNCLAGYSETQLQKALATFYARVEDANKAGIQFYLAATNLHVAPDELTDKNVEVFHKLADASDKHGIKNGIIVASEELEAYLRKTFGPRLLYISSCTKYYDHDRILKQSETLPRYLADAANYDLVVLTPQDSYDEKVMKACAEADPNKFSVVADVMCDRTCNAFHHYDMISRYNKTSLKSMGFAQLLPYSLEYMKLDCPITQNRTLATPMLQRVPLQVAAGITHFKVGRAFSTDMTTRIDELVAALQLPAAA